MTFRLHSILAACAALILFVAVCPAQTPATSEPKDLISARLNDVMAAADKKNAFDALIPPGTEIRSVTIAGSSVVLIFNDRLGRRPWTPAKRDELLALFRDALKPVIPADAAIKIILQYGNREPYKEYTLEDHITSPETIRAREAARSIPQPPLAEPVVNPVDYPGPPRTGGLLNRNLVIAPSHGWTWHKENRWQLQRARVYTIVEDLLPQSFSNPFLLPMLENAGATVFSARERDYQTAEVIVDNDGVSALSEFKASGDWKPSPARGWRGPRPASLAPEVEPFRLGTTIEAAITSADAPTSPVARYTPYIQRDGQYAVYVSWAQSPYNSPSVPVVIQHLGGATTVRVNQQVAGSTWIFVGFYRFAKGTDATRGSVAIMGGGAKESQLAVSEGKPTMVSADAVRFGGGMGSVAPDGLISGKPRYAESARYLLQYSGAPADMVYNRKFREPHFGLDYWSDIASRPEWANYLNGAPDGPNDFRDNPGLGVPIDAFLAWHTDAGFDEQGLIGTLSIYRVGDDDGNDTFPDGRTRWLNRDLTTIMQEEIVRTARTLYTSSWARRAVFEGNYGEARRGNMPSTLLELLSHHNFNDLKYGNDPRFRKDIARAVYKAILRFIAYSNGYAPVVTPLEPTRLAIRQTGNGEAELSWRSQPDRLEPSANPDGFVVYTSRDGHSFDNGAWVAEPRYVATGLQEKTSTFFRVTAANAGGESLPSAVVGTRWVEGARPVLIVDGFNRISGPAIIHEATTQGFDRSKDPGVGYHYNYGLVGDQYDFDPKSKWVNDLESPGMGGSQSNWEDRLELGNTFDHAAAHGAVFAELDMAFDSATADAYAAGDVTGQYQLIDWIAGRQRTIMPPAGMPGQGNPDRMQPAFEVLPAEVRTRLAAHLKDGGRLFISGAHVIEDLTEGGLANADSARFADQTLGVQFYKAGSTSTNSVRPDAKSSAFKDIVPFRFGRDLEPAINIEPTVYTVNSAESFVTTRKNYAPILEYGDTGLIAGLAGPNVVLIGFPLETVLPPASRKAILGGAMEHLTGWKPAPKPVNPSSSNP